ncbi:hypothetical protein KAW65_00665 [candidate division WOR-3 bacterium]|nr:hypothetical protein [candidate division WOR-3 bacterium]
MNRLPKIIGYRIKRFLDYKTNAVTQVLSVAFLSFCAIILVIYIGYHYNFLTTIDNQFKISVIFTFVLGIFSMLAFYFVRKLEKSIRERIESFAEFIEKANKVFSDYSTSYQIMVIYPYFGLIKSVKNKISQGARKRGEIDIHNKVAKYLEDNIKITFIIPNETSRSDFLNKIKSHPDRDETEIRTNVENTNWVDEWEKRGAIVHQLGHDNPLHMVISDRSVVWGSVGNPGECTGFYSSDIEVVSSFGKLFNCFLPSDKKD